MGKCLYLKIPRQQNTIRWNLIKMAMLIPHSLLEFLSKQLVVSGNDVLETLPRLFISIVSLPKNKAISGQKQYKFGLVQTGIEMTLADAAHRSVLPELCSTNKTIKHCLCDTFLNLHKQLHFQGKLSGVFFSVPVALIQKRV